MRANHIWYQQEVRKQVIILLAIGQGFIFVKVIWVIFKAMQSFPNINLDQIGLKRSTSWFLIWERISGDMGRSDSISLRKDGEGKYLERGNIFLQRVQNKRRKRRKVFLERKYFLRAGWKSEKEKEENNWRRKIFSVEEMGRKSRALQEVLADLK